MSQGVNPPRLIMFAGPNGSGKSTITRTFQQQLDFPTIYINPDEITKMIPGDESTYLERSKQGARLASNQRQLSLANKESFAFETVMSHPSKLATLQQASDALYDVTLVFVGTENPQINVERVARRVQDGGHDVPTEKIIQRYYRSMALLPQAVELANRAIIFDNTDRSVRGVVLENGQVVEQAQTVPEWIERIITTVSVRAQERNNLLRVAANKQEFACNTAQITSGEYIGEICYVSSYYAVQQTRLFLVMHERALLNSAVEVGQVAQIRYREGVGSVELILSTD